MFKIIPKCLQIYIFGSKRLIREYEWIDINLYSVLEKQPRKSSQQGSPLYMKNSISQEVFSNI